MAFDWRALSRRLHFPACLATMGMVSAVVFSTPAQPWAQPYWLMPPLSWAAIAFTWRGTIGALTIILIAAIIGTNPYAMRTTDPDLAGFILALALAVATSFGLGLASVISTQRRTAARLRDLMATVNLGVFITRELKGKILFWSHGAERLYGYTAAEAVGRISHDLLHTVHPIPLAEIEEAVITKGEWTGDLCHTTKGGRRLIVVARKVRRDLSNGRIITLLEVLHDVTVERADQAALAELNRTLERRVEIEVATRAETQQRARSAHHMQALGKISAGVAHEFNNILQAVVGSLECIARHPDDTARVSRFCQIALGATERGSIITSRLLAFSGRAPLHSERIESALVLDALRDVLAHTLGGLVTVRLDLEPLLPALVVDKSELETALINLATNARDAMPEGGTMTLSARADTDPPGLAAGRYIRFSVTDCGTGMDATTMRRSVEPFFTTKPVGSGTGLGLSMVKGFAEQSGGDIAISSTPDEGTTVTIWLPVTELNERTLQRPMTKDVPADVKAGTRVLFVDDEDMVREALSAGLEEAGFDVLMASSGAVALAFLDANEPVDVLVTDYAMPGMDGLALIRQARERRPGLACLILTGYVDSVGNAATDDGLASALSVLRKPIGAAALANSIRAALTLASNGHAFQKAAKT
jgi:PAS domain S-box-containing protein